MKTLSFPIFPLLFFLIFAAGCSTSKSEQFSKANNLLLNANDYFETQGLNFFVFSNKYDALFDDAKVSAVEIIHHGVRTATNGDVRLTPTPGQWDKMPKFINRTVDKENNRIDVKLEYPQYDFKYTLRGEARNGGFYLSIITDKPLPDSLVGIAGLNLEFFPPLLFEHAYMMDGKAGFFPTSAADNMTTINGNVESTPLSVGKELEVAPDAPLQHISIHNNIEGSDIMLFDGRDKQQNGTFVVRTLLPAKKTGKIAEWFIQANTQNNWLRTPNICYSQVGYHPSQKKIAVVELDKNDPDISLMTLYKIENDGSLKEVISEKPESWGLYTRYNYLKFDFSSVKEPGIYKLAYGDQISGPFTIDKDVYKKAWYPTLNIFMPVQMDHMFVREAYRVWHGAAHLDDAQQAPVNYSHWDGWKQGATTDSKYKPGEHIPGLNIGGWFDAGDFDIQTPSQQEVVKSLVDVWDEFALNHDETTINQKTKYTEIHLPDGKPDVLQQVEHGALQLIAQVKAVGHAIPGINESHLYQYRHLGDALTKSDGINGNEDDRMAFTGHSTSLNYNSAAALAAASRVLPSINSELAKEALQVAESIWNDEHNKQYNEGETPFFVGSDSEKREECSAAFELWRATGKDIYKSKVDEALPDLKKEFFRNGIFIIHIAPYMGDAFKNEIKPMVKNFVDAQINDEAMNPFGISISLNSWAGNGMILTRGIVGYQINKLFPDLVNPESIYNSLNYIYGCHPYHNRSFVSGVGVQPKKIAYGNNRADHAFIPGGIVPGVRLLNPDFPENKDDYQFHWSENEYVIPLAPDYIYLVNAVNKLLDNNGK